MISQTRKNITAMLTGYGISFMGDVLLIYATNWFLVVATHNTRLLGIVNGIIAFVYLVVNVVAGSLADRFNEKHIMIMCDLASAAACWGCVPFLHSITRGAGLLIAVLAILEAGVACYTPASKVIVAHIIPKKRIATFNTGQNVLANVVRVGGPLVGGVFVSLGASLTTFLLIDGGSFLLSAGLTAVVGYHFTAPDDKPLRIIRDLQEGVRAVLADRLILTLLILTPPINFFDTAFAIGLPYMVKVLLNGNGRLYGITTAALAIGGVVGGIVLAVRPPHRSATKATAFFWNALLDAGALFLIFVGRNYPVIVVAVFLSGFAQTQYNVNAYTMIQTHAASEVVGRVFSLLFISSAVTTPVANFLFGQVMPALQWNFALLAAVGMLVSVIGAWCYWKR